MSKNLVKFRKDKDYNDDYAFKTNVYERKKRDKALEEKRSRKQRYEDDYDYDFPQKKRR